MQIIVDEIDPRYCPFYIDQDWDSHGLPISYQKGCCRLSADVFGGELQHWDCNAEEGDIECPFCITYEEFKKINDLMTK